MLRSNMFGICVYFFCVLGKRIYKSYNVVSLRLTKTGVILLGIIILMLIFVGQ